MEAVYEGLERSGELVDAPGPHCTRPDAAGAVAPRRAGRHRWAVLGDAGGHRWLHGRQLCQLARATEIEASMINPAVEGEYVDVRPDPSRLFVRRAVMPALALRSAGRCAWPLADLPGGITGAAGSTGRLLPTATPIRGGLPRLVA